MSCIGDESLEGFLVGCLRGVRFHTVANVERFHHLLHSMDTYQTAACIFASYDQLVAICTSFCLCAQFDLCDEMLVLFQLLTNQCHRKLVQKCRVDALHNLAFLELYGRSQCLICFGNRSCYISLSQNVRAGCGCVHIANHATDVLKIDR